MDLYTQIICISKQSKGKQAGYAYTYAVFAAVGETVRDMALNFPSRRGTSEARGTVSCSSCFFRPNIFDKRACRCSDSKETWVLSDKKVEWRRMADVLVE